MHNLSNLPVIINMNKVYAIYNTGGCSQIDFGGICPMSVKESIEDIINILNADSRKLQRNIEDFEEEVKEYYEL